MNHHVPDFEMDDDYTIPTSSNLIRSKKSPMAEEEVMELLWENGQVVMQSQVQRSSKKSSLPPPKYDDVAIPSAAEIPPPPDQAHQHQHQHLFMQEDEMASWLHFDQDFCPADLFYPSFNAAAAAAATATSSTTTSITNIVSSTAPLVRSIVQNHPDLHPHAAAPSSSRPPIPPARRPEAVTNFAHFSRHKARGGLNESGPSSLRESTMVDSSDTPVAAARRSADDAQGNAVIGVPAVGTSLAAASAAGGRNRESTACEMTMTSSTGGSYATTEPSPSQKPAAEDRKRKGREEDVECYSEDAEFESVEVKKQVRGSTSTKRSRAAEVHNLSERRRRDRINEKMKALQELIPRCNKSDKASMLDEAIEYLKSLQMQVQMMSMGCGMVPMMFPGVQQYMPPMGMAMGMGVGMEMGMNRPMMPFPNVLAGAPLPTPTAAAHLGPRFPVPAFHMPHVPSHDSSQIAASQSDPMLSSLVSQNPNQPQVPSYTDPYQQFINLQQMQMLMPQSQAMTSKPSTSQGTEHIDNHQSGT